MRPRYPMSSCLLLLAACAGPAPVVTADAAGREGCQQVLPLSPTGAPSAWTRIAGAEGCLTGHGVLVAARPATDIGTRHFADRLVVVAGAGRFERVSSDMDGVYAPIVDRGVRFADDRLLLLGWLHTGPVDTVVALLFRIDGSSVILEDELIVDVGDTAVALDLTGPHPRVGVIVPGCALSSTTLSPTTSPPPLSDHACAVGDHEWSIRAKAISWTFPLSPAHVEAWTRHDEPALYCPPFQACPRPVVEPQAVTWFDVGRDGFSEPPAS